MNKATAIITAILTVTLTLLLPPPSHAQTPTSDTYEQNDQLADASRLALDVTIDTLTIYPADDPDWYRFLVPHGTARIEALAGTPGLDLTLNVYDPSANLIVAANDPASPNAVATISATTDGYYAIEVANTAGQVGWYTLRLTETTPTATPTTPPTPTWTPTPSWTPTMSPTATRTPTLTTTPAPPTHTPTPDLGGDPDPAEPNNRFGEAYRVAPGDVIAGLNINSGDPDEVDKDYFVMAVREGVAYVCRTQDLGPGLDTEMIVYHSRDPNDVVGGNDDEDTQAGQINSRVSFTARTDGDVYIMIGYKYPEREDHRYPGAATYTLTCETAAPAPIPIPYAPLPAGPPPDVTPQATPIAITVWSQPTHLPQPTTEPTHIHTITVLVGYDQNDNDEIDPNEGIQDIDVIIVNTLTNHPITAGRTDAAGAITFHVATNNTVLVSVPFLNVAREARPGQPLRWEILIPPATVPGIIP